MYYNTHLLTENVDEIFNYSKNKLYLNVRRISPSSSNAQWSLIALSSQLSIQSLSNKHPYLPKSLTNSFPARRFSELKIILRRIVKNTLTSRLQFTLQYYNYAIEHCLCCHSIIPASIYCSCDQNFKHFCFYKAQILRVMFWKILIFNYITFTFSTLRAERGGNIRHPIISNRCNKNISISANT